MEVFTIQFTNVDGYNITRRVKHDELTLLQMFIGDLEILKSKFYKTKK